MDRRVPRLHLNRSLKTKMTARCSKALDRDVVTRKCRTVKILGNLAPN